MRDRWIDIYSEKGLLLDPYLLPEARECQSSHPPASHIARDHLTPLIGCVSLARLSILCTLSKSVGPDCPDALPSLCLLITTWQLVKAHRVTRNEPKIHVIYYITLRPGRSRCFKRIIGMQSSQKSSRISIWSLHIPIYNLPPLEKYRKSDRAGHLGSSYDRRKIAWPVSQEYHYKGWKISLLWQSSTQKTRRNIRRLSQRWSIVDGWLVGFMAYQPLLVIYCQIHFYANN